MRKIIRKTSCVLGCHGMCSSRRNLIEIRQNLVYFVSSSTNPEGSCLQCFYVKPFLLFDPSKGIFENPKLPTSIERNFW